MRAHRGRTLLLLCTALLAAAVIRTARRGTDPVTLEFAVFNGSNWNVAVQDSFVIVQEAMKRFGESHPGVSVHCVSGIPKSDYSEWLSRKILTDDAPDVMVVLNEDADRFVKLGILRNLDPLIEGSDGIDTGALFQTALRMGRLSGHQYCLPIETMPNLMFVNKSLLQKEGIDVPSTGYTFEDLYRICVQVTKDTDGDGVVDQFGIYKYGWLDAAVSAGAKLFSDDGRSCNFNSEELKEAIALMQQLTALNQGQTVTQEDFDDGRVAFMPLSLAEYRTYKSYPYKIKKYSSFQWDCIEMPRGGGGENQSRVDSLLAGISSRSRHPDLAWAFLKFLSSDEALQTEFFHTMPTVPVLKKVLKADDASDVLRGGNDEAGSLDSALVSDVIENGRSEPVFEAYQSAMALADAELKQLYGAQDADLDVELRSVQQKVRNALTQYGTDS